MKEINQRLLLLLMKNNQSLSIQYTWNHKLKHIFALQWTKKGLKNLINLIVTSLSTMVGKPTMFCQITHAPMHPCHVSFLPIETHHSPCAASSNKLSWYQARHTRSLVSNESLFLQNIFYLYKCLPKYIPINKLS